MNLGDKKQANIYVPKNLHEFFVNVAKHTPFSVGDLYVMSATRILGRIPDLSQELDYQSLGMEFFQKLNGGIDFPGDGSRTFADGSPMPSHPVPECPIIDIESQRRIGGPRSDKFSVKRFEGEPKIPDSSDPDETPSLSSEITRRKKIGVKPVKTHRDDDQYLWMLQNEMEVWKPCFDRFTHLARVTAIQSPTDDDLNSVMEEQENLYVITFMGYSNPKKGSYGIYDREPLLSTNVGFFITTLICGDPEGSKVYAGRSMPRKLFGQLSETDLEKQAISTPEIMFTKPSHLSEEETPFWGYCEGAFSELEQIFQNHADLSYIEQQLDGLEDEDFLEDKSFKEVLGIILADHYGHWQYYLDNFEIKTAAEKYNPQGAEE